MNKLISRDQWKAYMDTGTADAPKNSLIGEGFTSFSESKNPKEYSRQYIHERTERTDVVGYAPSISYSTDVYSEDPVIRKIIEITDRELIGTDAQVTVFLVNEWEEVEGGLRAFQRRYSVIPNTRGDGTDTMIYSGTLKAVGDIVEGVWDNSTSTFTAGSKEPAVEPSDGNGESGDESEE